MKLGENSNAFFDHKKMKFFNAKEWIDAKQDKIRAQLIENINKSMILQEKIQDLITKVERTPELN